MYKIRILVLNDLQLLICHKTKPTKQKPNHLIYSFYHLYLHAQKLFFIDFAKVQVFVDLFSCVIVFCTYNNSSRDSRFVEGHNVFHDFYIFNKLLFYSVHTLAYPL